MSEQATKRKLTKKQLLRKLEKCAKDYDIESAHCDADALLVDYLDDDEIREAYNKIEKWYA